MTPQVEKILDVRGLTIGLGKVSPVQDLSFSVLRGQTLALVGESGSGKSLTALPERQMRQVRGRDIGMIFQEPMTSLNPVLTVGRQIAEVLSLHEGLSGRAARAKAVELLDLVRLSEPHRRVHDYPHQLSGGMRQRVMIAMAVACSPKLLVADEPTTALDVTIQAQILELLDRLCRELSMSVILITHDLGVVGQWADRVVVMYAGRKAEEADPEPLFRRPLHPYTRGLLGASPRIAGLSYREGALTEIPGSISSAMEAPGCRFAPRCRHALPSCDDGQPPLLEPEPGHRVACPVIVAQETGHAAASGR